MIKPFEGHESSATVPHQRVSTQRQSPENAEDLHHQEMLAVVSERARIARDLHDVVIQRLFATGLKLEALRSADRPGDRDEQIDEIVRDLDVTIRSIRVTIFGARESGTEDL